MAKALSLYPLKFQPILKEKVWGGTKLTNILKKGGHGNIGESWEISGVANNISEIINGPLKGKTLNWVLENYKDKLVGEEVYNTFGNHFPLLFKFIDAREDLSVQVHPDDALAKERHNSFGKVEMWYIMDVEKDARLILGFNQQMNQEKYLEYLSKYKITEILNEVPVSSGDAFILNPGTVHAIGGGILLAEIQQTSDITYRIYDWNRPDTSGKLRQLHTDLAIDAINFNKTTPQLNYTASKNEASAIGTTSYFSVNKIELTQDFTKQLNVNNSFTVYMCVAGQAKIVYNDFSETIKKGETILIPAQLSEIKFITNSASFLEVFIP
ncbi:MAG: mannose-6-phosphate isomerase [Aequorivita sp.]|nr:mannose-6-phosphate isomerase [Aequorivita sp.]|tara:strand:- start:606 stop:1583 length:978 start_codon:yes stop_codon:yes gene_type:complete